MLVMQYFNFNLVLVSTFFCVIQFLSSTAVLQQHGEKCGLDGENCGIDQDEIDNHIYNSDNFDARNHPNYNLLPDLIECGISWNKNDRTRFRRTANGSPTGLGKYLMVARLLTQNVTTDVESLSCSGSLINRRYVLTAGHCVEYQAGRLLSAIEFGVYDSFKREECKPNSGFECASRIVRQVEEIIHHPDYTTLGVANDIAIIRLSEDITFSDFVKPICLPYSESLLENWADQNVNMVGWGRISSYDQVQLRARRLSEVIVKLVSSNYCNNFISKTFGKLLDTQLCHLGANGRDVCHGDSGGPMIKNIDIALPNGRKLSPQFQIGITSRLGASLGCGRQGVPSISTNVIKFMPWILDNLRP